MADLPVPVKTEHRFSFSILYFATDAEAMRYAAHVVKDGPDLNAPVKFDGPKRGRANWLDEKNSAGEKVLFAVMDDSLPRR